MRRTSFKITAMLVTALLLASLGASTALARDNGPSDLRFKTIAPSQRDVVPTMQIWLSHFSRFVRLAGRFVNPTAPSPVAFPTTSSGSTGAYFFFYSAPTDPGELPGGNKIIDDPMPM